MTNADDEKTPKAQWSLARLLPPVILIVGLWAFFHFGLEKYATFGALNTSFFLAFTSNRKIVVGARKEVKL